MKTLEQIQKIKAVVLYILQHAGGYMDYIHLFKIMYFSQQKHLTIYAMPLMADTFAAKKHGPVPTLTYKVMRGLEGKAAITSKELKDFVESLFITMQDGHPVVHIKEGVLCDTDELSTSNIKMLDSAIEKYKDMNSFDLSDLSHDTAWLNAWSKTEETGEDTKMTLYEIAKAGGATKEMLNVIRERQLISHALS